MARTTGTVAQSLALLVAIVAAIDAARGAHWDQLGMLAAIAGLIGVELLTRRVAPPSIRVRADLATWLRDEAARTDDTPTLLADRALAAFRAVHQPAHGSPPGGP